MLARISQKLYPKSKRKNRYRQKRHEVCLRYLDSIRNEERYKFFSRETITEHSHLMHGEDEKTTIKDFSAVLIKTRFCRTIEFIERQTEREIHNTQRTILDIGDPSGSFLRYFKKRGVSVNKSSSCLGYLKQQGIEAYEGDIHHLDFADKSFDYSFAFEILEHVDAPLIALRELARVTRTSIFISIPFREATRVRPFGYWSEAKNMTTEEIFKERYLHHIHEFSVRDFSNLCGQALLKVVKVEGCIPHFEDPRFAMFELVAV